jgi:pyruvate/2-oxoacid:ferredoxin oxidoreductase beta subunit
VAGYVKLDSFHTTHGRAVPFATGLKLARPELDVVVFSGDGDLTAIGGNHFIHAARRNMDLLVICVNNFIYGMTGGQCAPTTPVTANTSTTPYGAYEPPWNIPHLARACGASYVARWTVLHVRRLEKAMREAMNRKGFRVIEVIAPCSTLYARRNRLGTGYKPHEVLSRQLRDPARGRSGGRRHPVPGEDPPRPVRRRGPSDLGRGQRRADQQAARRRLPAAGARSGGLR